MTEPIDTRALMAEIEADARARRSSGAVPRDLEAELDATFAALTPKGAERSFEAALQRAESDALFDYQPPVQSVKPGGTAAKKGLAKLSSWYIRHVGQQVTAFALAITNAVRVLGDRVDVLEAQVGTTGSEGVAQIADAVLVQEPPTLWNTAVLDALKGTAGRVLVANAGSGALVRSLVEAGVSAYGVEPVDPADVADIDPLLEIRSATLVEHLKTVAEGALSAVVLVGLTDTMTVGGVVDTIGRLGRVLEPGATLIVVTTDPEQWRRERAGLVADLSYGSPLAPATWRELLLAAGYDDVEVASADPEPIVRDLPGDDPATVAINEQLRALEAAIVVPSSHCIRARRSE